VDPTDDSRGDGPIPAASPFLLGIAGGSASGKTTLVRRLVERVTSTTVACVSFDAYYRDRIAPGPDGAVNFDHPDALEAELLAAHLRALKAGRPVQIPTYDFATHRRRPATERIGPAGLVVVDGILLFAYPEIVALLDGRIFVSASESVRLARRLARDIRERGRTEACVRAQFAQTVGPMHDRFVEPSRVHADRLVDGEGSFDALATELLLWAGVGPRQAERRPAKVGGAILLP